MTNADDILNQQQAWLDTLQSQLTRPSEGGFPSMPGTPEQQALSLEARIAALSRQKEAAVARYDAAIAEHQKALAALRGALGNTPGILQGSAPPAATAETRRPGRAAPKREG